MVLIAAKYYAGNVVAERILCHILYCRIEQGLG